MQNIRDIRRRIKSVESTKQITKAMEMVAAAKLRRAQATAESARPYSDTLRKILRSLAGAAEASHPFLQQREVKKTLLVSITSDKGLCGSYNHNVIREVERLLENYQDNEVELGLIGKSVCNYFRRRIWNRRFEYVDFSGNMDSRRVTEITRDIIDLYLSGEVDKVILIYTRFISTSIHHITVEDFLPITKSDDEEKTKGTSADYIFEPDSKTIYSEILPRFINNRIYMSFAEALASEHAARMLAMSNATKNAEDMIDNLTLLRNKVRQTSITRELLEIVAGAEALKG